MERTKKHMTTLDETQYWDLWGALKLGLAQKKDVKIFAQTYKVGCAK
jgi:hypothetical protein